MISVLAEHNTGLGDLAVAAFDNFIKNLDPQDDLSEDKIRMLSDQKLLHIDGSVCEIHSVPLSLGPRRDSKDGFCLRCHICGGASRKSIRSGSFFQEGKLSIIQQLLVVRELYYNDSVQNVINHTGACRSTIKDFYVRLTFLMEVWLEENIFSQHQYLFDRADEVEVDEMFRYWITPTAQRQYAGQPIEDGRWIIGLVNRSRTRVYIQCIKDRKKTTILPLLKKLIEPGTTIYSDALNTYKGLDPDYNHFVINKQLDGFARVEQLQGGEEVNVNVNLIENRWRWLRQLGRERRTFAATHVGKMCTDYMYRFHNKHYFDLLRIKENGQ